MSQAALNLPIYDSREVPGSSQCNGTPQRTQGGVATRDTTEGIDGGWEGLVTTTQRQRLEGGEQQLQQPQQQLRQDHRPLHQNRGQRKDVSRDITKSTRNMCQDASTGRSIILLQINLPDLHIWCSCLFHSLALNEKWILKFIWVYYALISEKCTIYIHV